MLPKKQFSGLKGVKGVTNAIQLKPKAEPSQIKNKIMEAFKRNAEVDANRIRPNTSSRVKAALNDGTSMRSYS